jgi:hypothetical protein
MDNRISQLTAQPSIQKSTADEPFGAVLTRTLGNAASVVGNTIGGGVPVLSAVLSSASRTTQSVVGAGVPVPSSSGLPSISAGSPGTSAGVSGIMGSSGSLGINGTSGSSDSSMAMLQAQEALQEQGQSFNMQYLNLQNQMQNESQQYTAISNIMKVRSDCAKSAINNIH